MYTRSNIDPEQWWLEDHPFLLERPIFRGDVKFPGCIGASHTNKYSNIIGHNVYTIRATNPKGCLQIESFKNSRSNPGIQVRDGTSTCSNQTCVYFINKKAPKVSTPCLTLCRIESWNVAQGQWFFCVWAALFFFAARGRWGNRRGAHYNYLRFFRRKLGWDIVLGMDMVSPYQLYMEL